MPNFVINNAILVIFLMLSWLVVSPALAQPASPVGPGPDPQFINNAILVLQRQRNAAQDEVAQAQAQLAVTQSKLDAANKELADLKAKAEPAAK